MEAAAEASEYDLDAADHGAAAGNPPARSRGMDGRGMRQGRENA